MKIDIIESDAEVVYTLGMNKHTTVSGRIIDIIALSDHQNFIVLSKDKENILIQIDSIYSITVKKRKTKKEKPTKPDFRAEVM